ncbi:MAG: hypothetical protein ABIQ88_22930 [Chitinophagaceae bacterium]
MPTFDLKYTSVSSTSEIIAMLTLNISDTISAVVVKDFSAPVPVRQ